MTALRGVGESSTPGGVQPIDSVGGRNDGLDVGNPSDFRTRAVEQLAKHLAAAAIAYQMGIPFDVAMRKYVEPHDQVGEMWKVAAAFVLDNQVADNSPTPGPELVGAGGNAA